ncbi:hypothetical protein DMP06_06895 [Slackia equolifaciens]|uniref:Uncharacterized protein n=1 Tax=Slackia equolifaciens TaxID=498718 RepID=A0A3N0AXA3_9ACTN|nr:hypothetical protein [Slackia equolifaciens]RNL39507.1 hypothetical protein DMP06_06895 [Slackia equolifaciens]HJF65037.1 hypothetical protein [Slackia equolifaciens]
MEDIGYVFSLATFAMVVALWSTMATKKDIRKIIDRESGRPGEMRALLESRKGRTLSLNLVDASLAANGTQLKGTLIDIDDEWALFDTPLKKGKQSPKRDESTPNDESRHAESQLVAIRLESIQSIEEND